MQYTQITRRPIKSNQFSTMDDNFNFQSFEKILAKYNSEGLCRNNFVN